MLRTLDAPYVERVDGAIVITAQQRRQMRLGMASIRKPPDDQLPTSRTPAGRNSASVKPASVTPASRTIEWSDLKYLLAVSDTGNITRAAEQLRTTQSTVSKRLEELEQRLGTQLVVSGQTGTVLTDAGRAVLVHASAMQRSIDAIYQEVAMRDASVAGDVSIACPDAIAAFILAPRVAAFQRVFPGIRLELRSWASQPVDSDLSIQFDETKRMSDSAIPLGWLHYVHFASQDYLDLYGGLNAVTDIINHRVLTHTNLRAQEERWKPKIKLLRELVDHAVRTDCSTFLVASVAHGAGIAAMPTYLAHLEPRLVTLGTGEHARVRLWLVHDQKRGELPRYRETIAWLRSVFDPRTNPWFREEFINPSEFSIR